MADKPLDKWEKFDIAAKAAGAILLPVVIWLVTTLYTSHQREAELAQRNADRLSSFLNHLASNNPKERKLSLEVLGYLAKNNQLPDELLTPLISTVNDEDQEVASAGSAALTQAATTNQENAKLIVKAADANPNTEQSVVKAAKSDPAFAKSIVQATESLKNDPHTAQFSRAFDRLRNLIVEYDLELISEPPGAKVYLVPSKDSSNESKYEFVGTSPITTKVTAGDYVAVFDLSGKRIKKDVSVNGDKNQVKVTFQ